MTATSEHAGNEAPDLPPPPQRDAQPLSANVRRGAVWSIASTMLVKLANILVTAVVAHILDPRDFGVFAVALTAYAIVSALGELGIAACLIRADVDLDATAPAMTTISFITSAMLAIPMAAFAKPIAAALGSANAAGPVRVMALAVLLVGLFAVPGAQLVREFQQGKLFLANVIGFVPSNIALLLLAKSGVGAMAFAWSRVIGQLITGLVFAAAAPKIYRPGFTRSALSLLFKFGLSLAGANFVTYVLLNVDYALVGHLMGPVALGTYVLAFNVSSWSATLLSNMINNVSMPAFSRVKHDPDLLKSTMASGLHAISLIVLPICSLTMAVARPLVLTLYGAKWESSANVLEVLSVYGALSVICLLFANVLAGLGRTRFLLLVQLIWLGALIPAMALGVTRGGIVGAAFAHVVVIGPIVLPCYLFALKRVTGISFAALAKAALPALLAALVAAGAAKAAASQFGDPLAQLTAGLAAGGLIFALAAAPQAIALIGLGQKNRHVMRILRAYGIAAQVVGLPPRNPPRHAARGNARRVQQPGTQERGLGPAQRAYAEVRATPSAQPANAAAAALELLLSLSTPVYAMSGPLPTVTGPLPALTGPLPPLTGPLPVLIGPPPLPRPVRPRNQA